VFGLGQEIREHSLVELGLSDGSTLEELLAGRVEGAVQEGEEGNGIFAQDLLVEIGDGSRDVDALEDGVDGSHFEGMCVYIYSGRGGIVGFVQCR